MKELIKKIAQTAVSGLILLLLIAGCVYALATSVEPVRDGLLSVTKGTPLEHWVPHGASDHDEHDHSGDESGEHAGHDHDAPAVGQAVEIMLSPTAAKNIGLDDANIGEVATTDYYKSFTFPAVVTERPGWSTITVPAPVSGIVTKIYHEAGVAVAPGDPLFDVQLNQQELVKAQTEYLTLLKKQEINVAELQRINQIDPELIPKQHRELVYDKMQLEQNIALQRKMLLLQGLKAEDVAGLEKNGTIIHNMTVYAPPMSKDNSISVTSENEQDDHSLTIDELFVTVGKNVAIGDSLCKLSDYCKLAIKGKVFAADEKELVKALDSKSRVSAQFEGNGKRGETVNGLVLRSVDNKIDTENGTLYCYVDLPNHFNSYEIEAGGEEAKRRFAQWHFKPGQRCELSVEYEPLPDCIVLPVDAVAQDFQETCVFEWVGDEDGKKIWRKTPVHVIYRTKNNIAIATAGSICAGANVAMKGAGFILAALDASNQKAAGGGGGIQHGDHVH